MKIAIIWQRFGPYHLARLQGAAVYGAAYGSEVVGVEIARNDSDYDWDVDLSGGSFGRQTVFPNSSYEQIPRRELKQGLVDCLNALKPDAVAINGWGTPEARCAIDWCRKQSDVCAVLMSETKEDDRPRLWWSELLKRRLVQRCDAALVGGRRQREYLVKLGFDGERVRIGYNVVDNGYFMSNVADVRRHADTRRADLGLPEHFFFACTRFMQRKNIDGLLRAYERYRKTCRQDEPWGLVIAGSGSEEQNLRKLASDLDVAGVYWAGFLQYSDLPTYFGLASAFVHPAKAEAWGLVINEAMSSGLPILSSNTVGAAYELVEEGENGVLFDPTSLEEMTRALVAIASRSQDELERMGQRSRDVVAHWTPERFGRELFSAATAAREAMGQ